MAVSLTPSVTPAEYAEARRINADKVLGWIREGELSAINVAQCAGGRPRYRITLDSIAQFEASRRTGPAPVVMRRAAPKPAKEFV
jgi:hypothetical protein